MTADDMEVEQTTIEPNEQKQNRGGAPRSNSNALRHGLRVAALPKQLAYIEHAINRLRRDLEAEVFAVHGEVSLVSAAIIQSVAKHETRGMLLGRWLRLAMTPGCSESDKLSTVEKATILAQISQATTDRDRALEKLRLGDRRASLIGDLYRPMATPRAAEETPRIASRELAIADE